MLDSHEVVESFTTHFIPPTGNDIVSLASLSLDLMEAIRPDVDAYLLDLIEGHVFRSGDFRETRAGVCRCLPVSAGVCRVNPPLTHHLATTLNLWYDLAAPVAEGTIRIITDGADTDTHLTQNNRRPEPSTPRRSAVELLLVHCLECGSPTTQTRKLCDTCRDDKRGNARLEKLASLRASGADPAHGGDAAKQRGESNREHQLNVAAWNTANQSPDPRIYRETILPGLQNVPIADIAAATGLTPGYCSFIRRGIKTPHPRHWLALEHLSTSTD